MAIGQEEIGRRIAQARSDADLTQQELAERIGITTAQSISRYERGETEVSTKRLRKIAEATGKPLSFFIQLPDDETPADPLSLIPQLIGLLEELLAQRPPQAPPEEAAGQPK